jgi:hypothetical protein
MGFYGFTTKHQNTKQSFESTKNNECPSKEFAEAKGAKNQYYQSNIIAILMQSATDIRLWRH